MSDEVDERARRWTLALGIDDESVELSASDGRMSDALTALYGGGEVEP